MKLHAHFGTVFVAAIVLASLTACTSTETNSSAAQSYASNAKTEQSRRKNDAQIYMFTGGFNGVFSTGVADMAA